MKVRDLVFDGYCQGVSWDSDPEEWEIKLRKCLAGFGNSEVVWELFNSGPVKFNVDILDIYGYSCNYEYIEKPLSIEEVKDLFDFDEGENYKYVITRADPGISDEFLDTDVKDVFDNEFWSGLCEEHLTEKCWKQICKVKSVEKPAGLK